MDRFSRFNPKVNLLFFVLVIIQTLMVFNPVYLAVSLVCACFYKLKLNGREAFSYFLKLVIPLILLTSVFNMLFAHYGETLLFSIKNINFTLEALFYGFTQGLMVTAVMLWFSCYNELVSSEMLLSVFGNFLPNTSLIFSMTMTFIPRLKRNAREITQARALLNKDEGRLSKSVNNLSSLVMMTLEESIEVSDSMRARGFNGKRTSYSKYKFRSSDLLLLISELVLFTMSVVFCILSDTHIAVDPRIDMGELSLPLMLVYFLLSILPLTVDLTEDIRWKYLKQKA